MKAIILAGGQSQRFGTPKAFAEIEGETFYKRIIDVLKATNIFNEIIISTNDTLASQFDHDHVIVDQARHKNKGPLAGIYSVMAEYPEETSFFIVSVDTPMITQKAISHLYQFMIEHLIDDQLNIAGFKEGDRTYPTIAFYNRNVLEQIETVLESDDLSIKHLYQLVNTEWLDVNTIEAPKYWYKNINSQEYLDTLKAQIVNN